MCLTSRTPLDMILVSALTWDKIDDGEVLLLETVEGVDSKCRLNGSVWRSETPLPCISQIL